MLFIFDFQKQFFTYTLEISYYHFDNWKKNPMKYNACDCLHRILGVTVETGCRSIDCGQSHGDSGWPLPPCGWIQPSNYASRPAGTTLLYYSHIPFQSFKGELGFLHPHHILHSYMCLLSWQYPVSPYVSFYPHSVFTRFDWGLAR